MFKVGDLVQFNDIVLEAMTGSRYGIVKKVEWNFSVLGDSHREWLTLHLANGTRITDFGYKFKRVAEC